MKTRRWMAVSLVLVGAGCGTPGEEYVAPDRSFKVVLPGAPKLEKYTQETPQGPITFQAAVVDRPNEAFMVAWADLPPKIPFSLAKCVETLATRYEGKVKEKQEIEKAGAPGLAFVITDTKKPRGEAVGRIYQVQDRLYELVVVGSRVGDGSREVEGFFNSFKLINPLMKPETTAEDRKGHP